MDVDNTEARRSTPLALRALPAVHSLLDGPINRLSMLRRSLLFAELSRIAYLPRADAGRMAYQVGLPETRFYHRDGAQAYIFANKYDTVVTCRGTESHDWNDWRADFDAAMVVAETVGRVHRGFKREMDDLWPRVERALVNNTRTVWFTGHSLGGAMATICAGRCRLSHIRSDPQALFTFGSPRVGNRRYVNFVKLEHYRWVHNNDLVAQCPPSIFGYRHTGQLLYLNDAGKLRRMTYWRRFRDRWRGFLRGLGEGRCDHLQDHAIDHYVKCIADAIVEQEKLADRESLHRRWRQDAAEPLRGPTHRRHRPQDPPDALRKAA